MDTALETNINSESDQNGNVASHGAHKTNAEENQPTPKPENTRIRKAAEILDLGGNGRVPLHTLVPWEYDTADGGYISVYQARRSRSLGAWVYDGAACLAKYMESVVIPPAGQPFPEGGCMRGKTLVELGAGTGAVGLLAGYHGADAIITDLVSVVPLIQYNIDKNAHLFSGRVEAKELCWGDDSDHCLFDGKKPDFLILANCIYIENTYESLRETMLALTDENTQILLCYEVRTDGIRQLIGRWHDVILQNFDMEYLPEELLWDAHKQDYIRLVRMKRKA